MRYLLTACAVMLAASCANAPRRGSDRTLLASPPAAHVAAGGSTILLDAERLGASADSAYRLQTAAGYDSAAARWVRAAVLHERAGRRVRAGVLLDSAALAFIQVGRPDTAERYIREALAHGRAAPDRGLEGWSLSLLGNVRLMTGAPDSALVYYRAALPLRRVVGDRAGVSMTLHNIGAAHGDLARWDSATVYFRQALAMEAAIGKRPNGGQTLSSVGVSHLAAGRPDSALAYFRLALAVDRAAGDQAGVAVQLNNSAVVYQQTGAPDSALAYTREALAISRVAGDRPKEARALLNIGVIHHEAGRHDSALVYFRHAHDVAEAVGDRNTVSKGLHNIALAHRALGRQDSVLHYYGRALAVERAGGMRAAEGTTLTNIGTTYQHRGQSDSAFVYYRRALALRREIDDRRGIGTTLGYIGTLYTYLGRPDSALFYQRESLAAARAVRARRDEGVALFSIAEVHAARGRLDSAVVYHRQSLAIDRELGDRSGEGSTLTALGELFVRTRQLDSAAAYYRAALAAQREGGARLLAAQVLHQLGVVHHRLGARDSALAYLGEALADRRAVLDWSGQGETLAALGDLYLHPPAAVPPDPHRAAAYLDSAAAAYARVRAHAGSDANAIGVADVQQQAYADWALAWLARADEVGPAASARGALAAVERGRAQALLALLAGPDPRPDGPADGERAAPRADLAGEGALLLARLARERTAALSYLVVRDTLVTWLAAADGALSVVRTPVAHDTLAALVRAALVGVEAPHGSPATFALARTRAALAGVEADAGGGVAPPARGGAGERRRLSAGRRAAGKAGMADTVALARLATLLLPPALRAAVPAGRELVVVAPGVLAQVPFAALRAGASEEPIGVRYALRYAPSLTSLEAVEARAVSSPRPAAARRPPLVVGNPHMPALPLAAGAALEPLPGAAREARWVAARLGTTVLTGAAATETAVLARLADAPLVHLATHGYAFGSDARARDSFVALAPDSVSDGLLTVGTLLDVAGPPLRADLVVLSGCQTGLGSVRQAEGTVGLARAFLARGARSVLVSLWSVSDEATALLMRRFYTHWLGDPAAGKAEALRRAQDDVRRVPRYAHPRYWGGFQLVGAR